MNKLQLIDINLYAAFMLLVLLIIIALKKNKYSISIRLFIVMIWSNIIILLLEALSWIVSGVPGTEWRWLPYLVNFIFILFNPLPAITWLCYVDYKIFGSIIRLKRRLFYIYPFIINAGLLIYSLKSGFMFTIDNENIYHRGPGIYVLVTIIFTILAVAFIFSLRQKKSIERSLIRIVVSFTIIPAIGTFLQMMFYGTIILWASMAISILIIYLFLESRQVTRDYLTGLYNRRQVDDWIHFRMRKGDKQGGFSLVMIDLNKFKKINDDYGHNEGDRALITFSNILTHSIKRRDMIARFAGDEFLLVLETDNQKEVETIISRLKHLVDEYNTKKIVPYELSFSAGSAIYNPSSHPAYKDLLKQADINMYANKQSNTFIKITMDN